MDPVLSPQPPYDLDVGGGRAAKIPSAGVRSLMCGIVGVLSSGRIQETDLRGMALTLRHRGPDDSGIWSDPEAGIGVGHARLSILDLSVAGHQPMRSASGRYLITLNGEIYNHLALRADLARTGSAPTWSGHSDTETLLAGFDVWGVEATVLRSVGMFAFAVWDRENRELTLVRDRLGEKPLYYGWQGDVFLFGSELKALRTHPSFRGEIDRDALTLFMRHGYISAPYSIYRGIQKQLPGTLLKVSLANRVVRASAYWDVRGAVDSGISDQFRGSPDEAVTELRERLREAVRQQMVADVPLGAFLSGGVDSSTIVALMQEASSRPVRTFTIGFPEASYNEAKHAKAVATHLGTDHTELYVAPEQVLDVIPQLPTLFCEPFADSSQIPTSLVSKLARGRVTVSLSGDGGDELFSGYPRYELCERLWRKFTRVPAGLRGGIAQVLGCLPLERFNRLLAPVETILPVGYSPGRAGDKLLKGAELLGARTPVELYRRLVSLWPTPSRIVIGGSEPPTVWSEANQRPLTDNIVHEMMAMDLRTYLPDDILVKVDRAAMGVGLETRVPLLDHRVVEFAWRLPVDYCWRDGATKWPLRQVLYKYVPRNLIDRPKMGFRLPIAVWLRGPLREWAEALLCPARLRQEGFFRPEPIAQKWAEHLSGRRNWQDALWAILMFQAWLAHENSTARMRN